MSVGLYVLSDTSHFMSNVLYVLKCVCLGCSLLHTLKYSLLGTSSIVQSYRCTVSGICSYPYWKKTKHNENGLMFGVVLRH